MGNPSTPRTPLFISCTRSSLDIIRPVLEGSASGTRPGDALTHHGQRPGRSHRVDELAVGVLSHPGVTGRAHQHQPVDVHYQNCGVATASRRRRADDESGQPCVPAQEYFSRDLGVWLDSTVRRRPQPRRRVKRSEIWTAAAGSGYAGKPRPVVIIQDDRFDATDSVTVCAFTTDPTNPPLIRLPVSPDDLDGLKVESSLMVDKIATVPHSKLGEQLGQLSDKDMVRLGRAVVVFFGLAGP